MTMVVRGHGGDNGPPNDDRPWEPPAIHKNAKGRKKGSDAGLIKKFEDGEKKTLGSLKNLRMTYFDMKTHFLGSNAKQIEKGMEAQFKGQYRNRKNKFKDDMFVSRGGYEQPHLAHSAKNKDNRAKLPQYSTQGSKSYAASRHEEWETNGVFPDLIELYKKTHQKEGKRDR
ncbi:formin-like protein 18, partial [Tanacetum coccineum]